MNAWVVIGPGGPDCGGQIALKGPPELTRTFPTWLLLSPFAKVERATTGQLRAE